MAGGMAGAYGTFMDHEPAGLDRADQHPCTIQRAGARLREGSGGRLDEVPSPYDTVGQRISFATVDFPDIDPGEPAVQYDDWAECIDPRFNWNAQDGARYWMYGHTIRNPPLNFGPQSRCD